MDALRWQGASTTISLNDGLSANNDNNVCLFVQNGSGDEDDDEEWYR